MSVGDSDNNGERVDSDDVVGRSTDDSVSEMLEDANGKPVFLF
jgi:hypothetical protein